MKLPTKPAPAKRVNPQKLVIFGKPKCGKTSITAELTKDGSWAILELEPGGADFVEAIELPAESLSDIKAIGQAIKEADKPYKGIIVDSVTKLEEMILPYAAILYSETAMGASYKLKDPKTGREKYKDLDVRTLAKGAGYLYMRQAFFKLIREITTWAHNIIFIGHLSDKMIEKNGEELSSKELDLTGKISKLMCAEADAVAYCFRKDNKTIFNFASEEEVVCGGRSPHLTGDIVVGEMKEGKLNAYWDRIYLPE